MTPQLKGMHVRCGVNTPKGRGVQIPGGNHVGQLLIQLFDIGVESVVHRIRRDHVLHDILAEQYNLPEHQKHAKVGVPCL